MSTDIIDGPHAARSRGNCYEERLRVTLVRATSDLRLRTALGPHRAGRSSRRARYRSKRLSRPSLCLREACSSTRSSAVSSSSITRTSTSAPSGRSVGSSRTNRPFFTWILRVCMSGSYRAFPSGGRTAISVARRDVASRTLRPAAPPTSACDQKELGSGSAANAHADDRLSCGSSAPG
jgi:hypothetical protein